jgi:hypothetical protein
MPFYERGNIRIHYEEVGSGFPLLVIPGGGLNSTVAGLATHPFNPFDEFKGEFRVIAADLRNAKGGQSTGPLEVDRPWDAYTDDHIGLMGPPRRPPIYGLGVLHRRPVYLEPVEAGRRPRCRRGAGAAQRLPSGDAWPLLQQEHERLGPGAVRSPPRHHDMMLPDDVPGHPYVVAMETVHLAPNAQVSLYPWKDTPDKIPLAVRHVRTFLRAHRPAAVAQSMGAAAQ